MHEALVFVSYNVRRCIGADRRHDPSRVAAVLRETKPDVVALQELSSRVGGRDPIDQARYLAEACGLHAIPGPTLVHPLGVLANALLTRLAPRAVEHVDLSLPGREPRAALEVELARGRSGLRVITTHLGLGRRERSWQLRRIVERVEAARTPLVVMGDMNEWRPGPTPLGQLDRRLGRPRRVRTFPARRPLLALDRIWVRPLHALVSIEAHQSPQARVASDHLPLRAVLHLPT